jgi:hypothetical protein
MPAGPRVAARLDCGLDCTRNVRTLIPEGERHESPALVRLLACLAAALSLCASAHTDDLLKAAKAGKLGRVLFQTTYIEKGEAIGAKSERERDWLSAIKVYYANFDKVDQDTRTRNYRDAMQALARKYPDDTEAKIFYALAGGRRHREARRAARRPREGEPVVLGGAGRGADPRRESVARTNAGQCRRSDQAHGGGSGARGLEREACVPARGKAG